MTPEEVAELLQDLKDAGVEILEKDLPAIREALEKAFHWGFADGTDHDRY